MKNNKGFSLIELIIVIAIMAVLVGTLAPQYVRYVEKAKVAADEQILDEFARALMVLSTEQGVIERLDQKNADGTYGSEISINFTADGKAEYKDSDLKVDQVWTLFNEIIDTKKEYRLKSSTYKGVVEEIKLTSRMDRATYNGHNKVRIKYYNGKEIEFNSSLPPAEETENEAEKKDS